MIRPVTHLWSTMESEKNTRTAQLGRLTLITQLSHQTIMMVGQALNSCLYLRF